MYSIKDLDQALEDMESGKVGLADSSVKRTSANYPKNIKTVIKWDI
jgi:hypothetical protein